MEDAYSSERSSATAPSAATIRPRSIRPEQYSVTASDVLPLKSLLAARLLHPLMEHQPKFIFNDKQPFCFWPAPDSSLPSFLIGSLSGDAVPDLG